MVQMIERDHSFDITGCNNYNIPEKIENFLQKNFMLSTNTTKLAKYLFRITYLNDNIEKELQNDNRITILHAPNKRIYIQIRGDLKDTQIRKLWNELEKDLKLIKKQEGIERKNSDKDELINKIINSIKIKGYPIEKTDTNNFIDNFIQKYNRLPQEEEIDAIVKGYIILKNEEYLLEREDSSKNEVLIENLEPLLEKSKEKPVLTSDQNGILIISPPNGRRKCPCCENEGLIHEVEDKNIILLDYPRIYGKKYYCGVCGQEWREK